MSARKPPASRPTWVFAYGSLMWNPGFKTPETLKEEFGAVLGPAGAENVVSYCGSGVSACHNLLAMEVAGLRGARLYPGSWSEWCADPSRPVESGEPRARDL